MMRDLMIHVVNKFMCCCRMYYSQAYSMARCFNMHCFTPYKNV